MIRYFIIALCCLLSQLAPAQTQIEFEEVASGYNSPVDIVHAHDSLLYVVEKHGYVQILSPDGTKLNTFLDIDQRVNSGANERGLLGMVFHPAYPDSAYFYVNYTNSAGSTVIARFTRDSSNATLADPASEKQILVVEQPYNNHNAGDLEFGPDGYLYIPLGDGGNGGDPLNKSQDPQELLGKLLRIDINTPGPYVIPDDNPFAFDDFTADEIWALGLRNPWRIDFDPMTGDLYIADVGQNAMEEINVQPGASTGAENYGWRCYEGTMPFNMTDCSGPMYTLPAYAYEHNAGSFCTASISGGAVYRGSEFPDLDGKYIFADYCSGMVGALYRDGNNNWQADTAAQFDPFDIVSISRHVDGELYMVTLGSGRILKIRDKNSSTTSVSPFTKIIQENPIAESLKIPSTIDIKKGGLYNASGQNVLSITPNQYRYDISTLSSGVYMLQLQIGERWVSEKIVVVN